MLLSVVEVDNLQIFGTDWCDRFQIWDQSISTVCSQINDVVINAEILDKIKAEFADVFQDKPGKFSKGKVQLHLKSDAVPVFRAKRPVAYAMLPLGKTFTKCQSSAQSP